MSRSSLVGAVSDVVAELMSSWTSAPTVTEAVFVALQLSLSAHPCAAADVALIAPTIIAATIKRDPIISENP
jgi:hypothetical protein